ncbi:MAG: hypothetical protein QM756_34990 [Polyangiaceae bacterium]
MVDALSAIAAQTERQVAHWAQAVARLNLDDLASPEAWASLERYLGVSLRRHLSGVIQRLREESDALSAMQRAAHSATAQAQVQRRLLAFRAQFVRAETTLDFFADAINTRGSAHAGALLRACDTLAYRSMAQLLDPLGMQVPVVLSFVDKGLGAAIMKAGLRLWDGGEVSPVATIRVVWHNLLRPTALIHEAGHQVAHITQWTAELSDALERGLAVFSGDLARIWAGWASEIAADAFAFANTGFASVLALHDVIAGEPNQVFRFAPGDPHPVSYLRVLLGVETCRYFYGAGPWDELALSWTSLYSPRQVAPELGALFEEPRQLLQAVVRITLDSPMQAFKGRSLRALVQPERVSPRALGELEQRIGAALFTSAHWLWTEPLRILALTGLRVAERPRELADALQLQEQAMLRLGGALQAA